MPSYQGVRSIIYLFTWRRLFDYTRLLRYTLEAGALSRVDRLQSPVYGSIRVLRAFGHRYTTRRRCDPLRHWATFEPPSRESRWPRCASGPTAYRVNGNKARRHRGAPPPLGDESRESIGGAMGRRSPLCSRAPIFFRRLQLNQQYWSSVGSRGQRVLRDSVGTLRLSYRTLLKERSAL